MLHGRRDELARIENLLQAARESTSGVLVVRGEAGVGKSALLGTARERADGMRVLACHGVESEAALPFAAVHQLVRPVLHRIDALPEPQAQSLRGALGLDSTHPAERFFVSLAVLSLLAEAAEHQPLLCLVDDAQWLDDSSADTLVFVARRLGAESIVMLFAARDGEPRRFEAPGLPELTLGGLDRDAAGALLDEQAMGELPPEMRERLIDGTSGNPLALLELPAALRDAQTAGAELPFQPLPLTTRVQQAFLARARQLPSSTQRMLLLAAADDTGEVATVLRAARRMGVDSDALDAAQLAGLVHVSGSQLRFRHPLVRSAVYQGAPLSRRQDAHRALAAALDADWEVDRRAWHRAAATSAPDPVVGAELEQAAERARRRHGPAAASLAFERAAYLADDDRDRARRLIAAAESAWFGGRPQRAAALYDRARPLSTDPVQLADIDRGRGLIEINRGVPGDGCRRLVRAAAAVADVDVERALYMLGIATVAGAYGGELEMLAAMRAPAAADTPVSRFLSAHVAGVASFYQADFGAAAESLRTALDLADDADAAGADRFPGLLIMAGAAALFLGDERAARRMHHRLAERTRETGALTLLTQTVPRQALSEIWEGRWQAARAVLQEGLSIANEIGQPQVAGHLLAELAVLAALRGDDDECRSLVAQCSEPASAYTLLHVANLARSASLALALANGQAEDALAIARQISEPPISLWTGLDRIEAAARAGDRHAAGTWLAEFDAWAQHTGTRWTAAAVLHGRALLADDADAERLFRDALAAHADADRPFERARAQLAYAEFLRRTRRRVDARAQLRAALDGFELLGARTWSERARAELRASGQTARRRDPSALDQLTAQELQIAGLVARGLTNREVAAQLFLSPRTVDFHLRNIFRKLSVTSRTQLARLDLGAAGTR